MAIEFAIIFPLFLLIFYAIVSYSLLFVYKQGVHGLSADAVRQAISVERLSDGSLDEGAITLAVTSFINEEAADWLGSSVALCDDDLVPSSDSVRVCVQASLDLPQINFSRLLPGGNDGEDSADFKVPANNTVTSTSSIRL
ncbi:MULTISPECIES: TadE/TadG family type IV pilus assembly protein [Halomonas]|uniref:TadE-like domain-containing protein n=1 Tax=Halomonas halophila TaxID=29573 RepID=A0ABQ0U1K6_9GAMM|nr:MULTISPECIES: TadE/TadG family type IV pilus assembly protein [Halomonas]MDR5888134.1 TadE/TadG family type IV pilus assembly protein [Halomonas salina]WJY08655.1 TadE/TadG family type IV pilus assembly protein [Halomonas halophila]GEK72290.1 hypothetical protein HHA04nite_08340 [Halomonas halophila]